MSTLLFKEAAEAGAVVETQLARDPFPFPTLRLRRRPASIFEYEFEDFEVLDYRHHPPIKAPVAV